MPYVTRGDRLEDARGALREIHATNRREVHVSPSAINRLSANLVLPPYHPSMRYLVFLISRGAAVLATDRRSASAGHADAAFLDQTNAAMTKMMADMGVAPTGDVDRDFVATMVPHHRGAIDMAIAELRFGRNVRLRRIASEIIVTQKDEIVAMRRALSVGP